jgi:periplasmic glucans biosynthesis protein
MTNPSRRDILATAFGTGLLVQWPALAAENGPVLGAASRFDFDILIARAKELAGAVYRPAPLRNTEILDKIDYDAFQEIRFRPEAGLWHDDPGKFAIQAFHLGKFFKAPVRLHQLAGGQARELLYAPALFDFGKASFARALPDNIGFSGFRVMHPGGKNDWLAFLGASYFRSAGELDQYGLSARGLAIDVATPTPEEFPRYTNFWIDEPEAGRIIIYALLEGPSIAGAYRFEATDDRKVVLTIDTVLFARSSIDRLGVAPLTSMFWYGKNNRARAIDWRPELHDSDGLALWTGAGERIWRPLNDPASTRVSSFLDTDPRGFGLLQRERSFDTYQDDSVFYNRRPSVWVEPTGHWGKGSVQLVEIPTDDETNDNIVAYWVPAEPVTAGDQLRFGYKLHWLTDEPYPPATARVIATRTGVGGVPGQPRPQGQHKFAIDFAGGELGSLGQHDGVEPVVSASRGKIVNPYALPIVGTKDWRLVFDLARADAEPVDLRCFLRRNGTALTETWLYQDLAP